MFGVDDHIFQHKEEEIKQEKEQRNEWMKGDIDSLPKFNNKNIIKVQFKQSAIARRTIEQGILAYNMSIPAKNIKQEKYIQRKTCMRCYKLDNYFTNECPKDKNYKIRSECGNLAHIWRECKETTKKYVSCEGNHRTLAYKCPLQKKIREVIRGQ